MPSSARSAKQYTKTDYCFMLKSAGSDPKKTKSPNSLENVVPNKQKRLQPLVKATYVEFFFFFFGQ